MPLGDRIAARRAAKAGGAPQEQAAPEQAAPEQAPAQATSPKDDPMSELKQLGELHEQGILTDEEFEAEKKKILSAL